MKTTSIITLLVTLSLLSVSLKANHNTEEAVATRVEKIGSLNIGDQTSTSSSGVASTTVVDGKATYDSTCALCHNAGVAGAPKFGDAAAWSDRAQDIDALAMSVINGKGAMPPRAGRGDLSDQQIVAAVEYIIDNL